MSTGGMYACGVRVDQTVACWGDNDEGHVDAPTGKFVAVSSGGGHSCGLRVDHTVTCWGSNQDRHGNHVG